MNRQCDIYPREISPEIRKVIKEMRKAIYSSMMQAAAGERGDG